LAAAIPDDPAPITHTLGSTGLKMTHASSSRRTTANCALREGPKRAQLDKDDLESAACPFMCRYGT
jgi:hypothetical protein